MIGSQTLLSLEHGIVLNKTPKAYRKTTED